MNPNLNFDFNNDLYTRSDLAELEEMLRLERLHIDELNETTYKNNEWNSAPEAKANRLLIAVELLKQGTTPVRPFLAHGIGIPGAVISPNQDKWRRDGSKEWMHFRNLSQFAPMSNDALAALMEKKRRLDPTNDFWTNEARVRAWAKSRGMI